MNAIERIIASCQPPMVVVEEFRKPDGSPIDLITFVFEEGDDLIVWTSEDNGTTDEAIDERRDGETRIVDLRARRSLG